MGKRVSGWLRVPGVTRWAIYSVLLLLGGRYAPEGHHTAYALLNYLAGMCFVWLLMPGDFWHSASTRSRRST